MNARLATAFTSVVVVCAVAVTVLAVRRELLGPRGGADVSGVPIAVTDLAAFVEGAQLTFSEVRSIRHPFGRIAGVAVGGDGAVYVGDNQALMVWQFDSTGVLVDSIGAMGDGPGDFVNITSVSVVGDRLLVFDGSLYRLTSFDGKDPGKIRTTTFRIRRGPAFAWGMDDGRVVAGARSSLTVGQDTPTDSTTVHLVSEEGVVESWGDTLLSFPRTESLTLNRPGFVYATSMPFARRSWVRVGSGGTVFCLWSGTPEVLVFSPETSAWDTLSLPLGLGRPVEDRDWVALYASIDRERASPGFYKRLIAEARAAGRTPPSWPVASGLLADDSNRLWVTLISEDDVILAMETGGYEYGPHDGGGSHLLVFDLANGTTHTGRAPARGSIERYVGSVDRLVERAPARGSIEAVSGEHVYLLATGPNDEEYLRQFRVRAGPS